VIDRLRVATLNIRNLMDRWDERLPLVLADMRAVQPDLLGLQEVVYPLQQDRLIGAAGEGRYETLRGWATRLEYGNAILVKSPLVAGAAQRQDLGHGRCAVRTDIVLASGARIAFATTHFHHPAHAESDRYRQAAQLMAWLDGGAPTDARIVVGDFNAKPTEGAYGLLTEAGYRSAFVEAVGAEPAVTWPSGLDAPMKDTDGDPACLDYIWLMGDVRATAARLAWDRPAVGDPTLYPSDHLGLVAELEVGTVPGR
jgi:endonuclease/exonuclease/phosphatase family metal-dependent hydrolase